jgi:hypothetical protein
MIGIDTSIRLRWRLDHDPAQNRRIDALLAAHGGLPGSLMHAAFRRPCSRMRRSSLLQFARDGSKAPGGSSDAQEPTRWRHGRPSARRLEAAGHAWADALDEGPATPGN